MLAGQRASRPTGLPGQTSTTQALDRPVATHATSSIETAASPAGQTATMTTSRLGLVALDALPIAIIMVDAAMRVIFANAAAGRMTSDRRSGLRITYSGSISVLTANHRGDASDLRSLVAATANNAPGGAIKLHSPDIDGDHLPMVAVTVTQAPSHLAAAHVPAADCDALRGLVLITARDLASPEAPDVAVLSDMFHLSAAEAAVAAAMLGGATAESVAITRQVSLNTVRRQIQEVLRKAEAHNLRDLERMAAMLASMPGPARASRTCCHPVEKFARGMNVSHQFW
jgi:DNA-binding CsgD family transcriptional regulator